MKRVLLALLIISMIFTGASLSAFAEDLIKVNVNISLEGELVCACEQVDVTDVNGSGTLDMDDAVAILAEIKGVTYESGDLGWGRAISNLWGDDSGNFGYYLNGAEAWNLDTEIKSGDLISVYSYKDTVNWGDRYTYFDNCNAEVKEGESIMLSLNICHKDESWSLVTEKYSGALIMEGDKVLGTTDENGNITLNLEPGVHTIYCKSADETVIIPAAAIITVLEEEIDIMPAPAEKVKKEHIKTPDTGYSLLPLLSFLISFLILFALLRKIAKRRI